MAQFHRAKHCPIKVEAWGGHEKDGDDDITLIIDQNKDTVYHVQDIGIAIDSVEESGGARE